MAGDFYYSSPQTSQLRSSSSTRQALLDTISPDMTEQDINQAAERINTIYDQRKNELRRRYADFPEMASSEETALERDRANDLAKVSLDTRQKASESTRGLLLNLEQMDENKRRWDIQDNARMTSELNAGLQQHRINNAAKRMADQSSQTYNYRPMSGPREMRGDYIPMSGSGGREQFVAERITNKRYQPAIMRPGTESYDNHWETKNLYDRILGGIRESAKPKPTYRSALASRSNISSRSRPNFRPIGV